MGYPAGAGQGPVEGSGGPAGRSSAAHVIVADLEVPVLDDLDAHHLRSVLRLRPGEEVTATDGNGGLRWCVLGSAAALEPCGDVQRDQPSAPALTVAFAPVKGDRTEWAVQKLTEVGVERIVLLSSERSVVRWDGSRLGGHLERLSRVIRSAVMQSRRCWIPTIDGMVRPADLLAGDPGAAMADPEGDLPGLDRPTILIGPEGGWSPSELAPPSRRVRLGEGILRSETAAVVAGTLLCALRSGLVVQARR